MRYTLEEASARLGIGVAELARKAKFGVIEAQTTGSKLNPKYFFDEESLQRAEKLIEQGVFRTEANKTININPFQILIDREDDIQRIAQYFNVESQRAKTIEELSEALTELSREFTTQTYEIGELGLTLTTLQELADVLIMIAQLSYYADCARPDDHTIANTINMKLDRTLNRIKAGYRHREANNG